MTRLRHIFADYRLAGAVADLFGVHSVLDEQAFLTKSGHLLSVFKAEPLDHECLDPEQLDRVARRFEAAVRILNGSFHLRQYLIRVPNPEVQSAGHDHPVVDRALSARAAYLNARGARLHTLEVYFVLTFTGWHPRERRHPSAAPRFGGFGTSIRRALSVQATSHSLHDGLSQARRQLRLTSDSFAVQLQDVMPVTILDTAQAFRFFRRLLNYAPHKVDVGGLKSTSQVGYQAADSALECHRDHLRVDDYYVQVLTLKEPPSHTFANLWSGLQEIRSSFVITTEWTPQDNSRIRREIQSKRRHFYNSKASFLNHVMSSSQTLAKDQLIDTGAAAHVDALGACLEAIDVHGRQFGEFSLTLVLFDQDRNALQRSVAEAFKVFADRDGRIIEERYNQLNAWLAVLPGNDAYNLRRMLLLDSNYADLSFLFAQRTGDPVNAHLRRSYLVLLEGTCGTPFYLNLHVQDVAHTIVLGATGSGKSFLLNFLITFLQQYSPRTFIFDLGGGYRSLTHLFGGAYVPVAAGDSPFAINPFCLPLTPEHLNFLVTFLRVLIESSGYQLTAADETDLVGQIEALYAVDPDQRRLLTLANIVRRNLRGPLQKWVEGGPNGRWFDNAGDTVSLASFQTFDFEGMADYPQILEPLLFYILHRANAAILDPALAGVLKIFVLDEAWRFFRNPAIKQYIVEALKTWRKKNAAVILATQSVDDLRQSNLLPVVVESCATQLFLANPGMDRDAYRDIFHLNDIETERIAGLIAKKQILVKQPGLSKVVDLNVDPQSYWLFTNTPSDNVRRQEIFDRHGLAEGLEILADASSRADQRFSGPLANHKGVNHS